MLLYRIPYLIYQILISIYYFYQLIFQPSSLKMPLKETLINNKLSSSIEDLISQIDAPLEKTECKSPEGCGETRKIIKGKRNNATSLGKNLSSGSNGEPVLAKNIIISKKYSTHKRSLNNRGQPKKGGAGGKGVWGAPGCELDQEYLDTKDPNYDSDQEAENVVMVCVENDMQENKKPALKQLEMSHFDTEIKLVILEYFQNGDSIEVIDTLKCFDISKVKQQLISFMLGIALEHNNTCKELMSRLLRDLKLEMFDENEFVDGFDLLMKNIDDIVLDNPDAPEKIGIFVARAIADKVLPKSYLDRNCEINNDKATKALESSRLLINMNDHLFQLSHIWGNKGGFLAVKELTDKINELIQEYHDSGDVEEAIRCLKDLNVPHFHHEFIYEALDFALQKGNGHAIDLITTLLDRLCKAVIVTYDQLKIGFTRIFDLLPDINLDVPNANALMDTILNESHSKGFMTEAIMELAPNRSRKRFVSEGDGGRFKDENTQ